MFCSQGKWRANVFKYILSGKSTRRSTPLVLRFCLRGTLRTEIEEGCVCFALRRNEERMYSNIYCPESQRGDQPLQNWFFFWEQGKPTSSEIKEDCVCFVLRGNEEQMYSNIYCPESQSGDQPTPSELSFFFFFFERNKLSSEIKEDCVHFILRVPDFPASTWLELDHVFGQWRGASQRGGASQRRGASQRWRGASQHFEECCKKTTERFSCFYTLLRCQWSNRQFSKMKRC